MIRIQNGDVNTGWLSKNPTRNKLEKMTLKQLILLATVKKKKGLKKVLVDYLEGIEL